jgi:DNA polymerase-1
MAKFFVGQLKKEKPDYIVFIKDAKGKNFRHDLYVDYKATRERMPDSLRSQIGDIEEMIARMGIDIIEIPGFEADDVIGTLAVRLAEQSNNEIYILSGDKDLYALVNEQVKIYDTQRKKISGLEETFKKFGVSASCVRDYLAICGDSSDNIP